MDLHEIYLKFGDFAVVFLAVSSLICIYKFKKLDEPLRNLSYFLFWNLVIEIIARIISEYYENNLPLLHLYTLGEFILLSFFYKKMLEKPIISQNKFLYFILGGSVFIILNSLFYQNIYGFNSIAKTFVQVIVIIYSVLYFYHLTEDQSLSNLKKKGWRLINSAMMIYYSGSLFVFMFGQITLNNSDVYMVFWVFNAVLNLVFQIMILWGISKIVFHSLKIKNSNTKQ